MAKLTSNNQKQLTSPQNLTRVTKGPFVISFCRKLEHGYNFMCLEKKHLMLFQKFLDIASALTVQEMDKKYRRDADKNDTVDGQQVQHYGADNKFRLHGVYIDGRFEVIRIDPNHKVHK